MRRVNLAKVTEPVATWNPAQEPDVQFLYVDVGAVDNVAKAITQPTLTSGIDAPSRARQLITAGDVLVSTVRPNLNAVAYVEEGMDGATASTGFTVLRASKMLNPRYLFHWVRTKQFVSDMVSKATGASYPAVSDRIVKNSTIPLPPLGDQIRIATILDHASSNVEQRRKTIEHHDVLGNSVFIEMFEADVHGSCGDARVPLNEVVDRITYGFTNPMSHVDSGVPIVTARNIRSGQIDLTNGHFTTQTEFEALSGKSRPQRGDVLITKDGTIGRCAVVRATVPFCINQSVALVRPNLNLIEPDFLFGYLTSPRVQAAMTGMGKGNALKHLQITELAKMPIPYPAREKQRAYTDRMRIVGTVGALRNQVLDRDVELFESLQSRAFSGRL